MSINMSESGVQLCQQVGMHDHDNKMSQTSDTLSLNSNRSIRGSSICYISSGVSSKVQA